jgi:hypothetical protein
MTSMFHAVRFRRAVPEQHRWAADYREPRIEL